MIRLYPMGFSHLARPYRPGGVAFFALEVLDVPVRNDFQSRSETLSSPDLAELQCCLEAHNLLRRCVSTFNNDFYRGSCCDKSCRGDTKVYATIACDLEKKKEKIVALIWPKYENRGKRRRTKEIEKENET